MQTKILQEETNGKKNITFGDWSGVIDLAHGANCISLRNSRYDANLLREPPEGGELDNPYLYGMPILFPVNRIENGRFEFEGREYCFPINEPSTGCHLHGELHRMPFELVEESESRVVCCFRAEKGEYRSVSQLLKAVCGRMTAGTVKKAWFSMNIFFEQKLIALSKGDRISVIFREQAAAESTLYDLFERFVNGEQYV